jgi:uncharacterized Zn finger protein
VAPSLRDACSRRQLERLAGERSFARGEAYAAEARVRLLSHDERGAVAVVAGNSNYRVLLGVDADGRVQGSCTCPVGAEGAFCKHCVATALVLCERESTTPELRSLLTARPHDELVELLVDAADRDPVLRDRLG